MTGNEILNFAIASLISADNNYDEQHINENLMLLEKLETSVADKSYLTIIQRGKDILKSDLEKLKNEQSK